MNINTAAKFAMHNKDELKLAQTCGCYYCLAIFDPKEIKEWTDDGDTALCPYCQVDAVLAGECDREKLQQMHKYWF